MASPKNMLPYSYRLSQNPTIDDLFWVDIRQPVRGEVIGCFDILLVLVFMPFSLLWAMKWPEMSEKYRRDVATIRAMRQHILRLTNSSMVSSCTILGGIPNYDGAKVVMLVKEHDLVFTDYRLQTLFIIHKSEVVFTGVATRHVYGKTEGSGYVTDNGVGFYSSSTHLNYEPDTLVLTIHRNGRQYEAHFAMDNPEQMIGYINS